jgi:hypothetical protein
MNKSAAEAAVNAAVDVSYRKALLDDGCMTSSSNRSRSLLISFSAANYEFTFRDRRS